MRRFGDWAIDHTIHDGDPRAAPRRRLFANDTAGEISIRGGVESQFVVTRDQELRITIYCKPHLMTVFVFIGRMRLVPSLPFI